MKLYIKFVLWVCLSVSLILLTPSVKFRMNNESKNRTVLFAADIQQILALGHHSSDSLIQKLKDSSIQTVEVGENKLASSTDSCSYDLQLIEEIRSQGLHVILAVSGVYHDEEYYKTLKNIIQHYEIDYLRFEPPSAQIDFDDITPAASALKECGVTVLLTENTEQTGHTIVPGLDTLLEKMNFAANRTYITPMKDLAVLNQEDLFFRWLRGITDRNIRVIYVKTLRSTDPFVHQNLEGQLKSASALSKLLVDKGYYVNEPLPHLSTELPGRAHSLMVLANLLLAMILFLGYLGKSLKTIVFWMVSVILTFLILFLTQKDSIVLLWEATAASIVYPSFSIVLLLVYGKYSMSMERWKKTFKGVLLFAFGAALGIIPILAAMSDIRFILHTVNFSGAMLTYTLPLVIFPVLYLFLFTEYNTLGSVIEKLQRIRKHPMHLFFLFSGIFLFYIYLSRSGNTSLLPASSLELYIRKILEDHMTARPRFKEFLIGYPCFFAFLHLHKKTTKTFVSVVLGLGTTIGIISVFNSFCHGFTPIIVSLQRSLNGFILGIFVAITIKLTLFTVKKVLTTLNYSSSSKVRKNPGIKLFIK